MPSPPPEPATAVPAPGLAQVAAGITLFHPTAEQIAALPGRLPQGLCARLAFANSVLGPDAWDALAEAGFTLLGDGTNLGIAEALNRLAEAAGTAGAQCLYLLDQDAAADPALPASLLAGREALRALGLTPAVVGPAPAAAAGHKAPSYPARSGAAPVAGLRPVQFLATSGSLVPRQPLFRMATYLRNSVYAWRLPHLPLSWKLAQGLYLPAQAALYWADSGCRPAVLARLAGAARDGLLGRLGPPRDFGR